MAKRIDNSSFRDPDGFVFRYQNIIYRQVNISCKENYNLLINSGLYRKLQKTNLLIRHREVRDFKVRNSNTYKILKPELVPFISYPYEWCFSELKDAALATIKIQKLALEHEMILKDASSYNIQFISGKPVLIDTLSFEKYEEGKPWIAYRQFCQHFLAPLLLASFVDVRLINLLRFYIDGIPLDLTSKLLPKFTYLSPSLLFHVHLHAKAQTRLNQKGKKSKVIGKFGRSALYELIESLENIVLKLSLKKKESTWVNYYKDDSYSSVAFNHKVRIVEKILNEVKPKTIWDLGANIGVFSFLASRKKIETIAFDNDPVSVEKSYIEMKKRGDTHFLPLVSDLTNPSPSQGFANEERMSLIERGPADIVFALALVHHLSIAANIPFKILAEFLSKISTRLIIEFVPKTDKKVQLMLSLRKDVFDKYDQDNFEVQFSKHFTIERKIKITNSQRLIYVMRKR